MEREFDRVRQTEEQMRLFADLLSMHLRGWGFALLVFPFGDPGISNYISNAQRGDMITALREAADRLEKNEDIPAIQGQA